MLTRAEAPITFTLKLTVDLIIDGVPVGDADIKVCASGGMYTPCQVDQIHVGCPERGAWVWHPVPRNSQLWDALRSQIRDADLEEAYAEECAECDIPAYDRSDYYNGLPGSYGRL